MPQVNVVPGPGGSLVDFSSLPVHARFSFGGDYFMKKNDDYAFRLSTGQLVTVLPTQQVSAIAVSWQLTPFTIADVQGGDGFIDPDGAEWIRVEGGAIHVQSMTYADDGNVPPLKSMVKQTVLSIDE